MPPAPQASLLSLVVDAEGRVVHQAGATERLPPLPPPAQWADLWSETSRAAVQSALHRARNGEVAQTHATTRDGGDWELLLSPLPLGTEPDGPRVVAMLRQRLPAVEAPRDEALAEARLEAYTDYDVLWEWDLAAQSVTWSETVATLFGYDEAAQHAVDTAWWRQRVHPDDVDRVVAELERVQAERRSHWSSQYRFRRADGSYAFVYDRGFAVHAPDGTPLRMIGAMLDLSDLRRMEAENAALMRQLEAERTRFEVLLQQMPAGVIVADHPSGELIIANRQVERILRHPFRPAEGMAQYARYPALHADGTPYAIEAYPLVRALAQQEVIEGEEILYELADGERITLLVNAAPVRDAEGEVIAGIVTFVDVTAQKAAEETLRAQARSLETISRVNATLAAELDLEKLVQAVTDAGTELTGASFGAFFYNVANEQGESYMLYTLSGVPRSAFERFPMPRNTAIFHPTFAGEDIIRLDDVTADPRYGKEAPHYGMPEGHLPVRSYLAAPVVSRSGEVIGGLFFGHPEPGVFTERAERLLASVADQAAIAIENARLFKTANTELAERRRAEDALKRLNETLEQRVRERTTALEQANVRLQEEVDERARTEHALRESQSRYQSIILDVLDNVSVGVFILDAAFRVVWINRTMCTFFGLDREAVLEQDKRQLILANIQHLFEDPETFVQKVLATYDDNTYVENFECHVLPTEGRKERFLEHWSKPIQEGSYAGGRVELYTDITALRDTLQTLGRTNEELEQRNRELQEFAYVASHDLQEPLRKIRSFSDLVRADHGEALGEEGHFYLERVQRAADRMSTLIANLLSFSRVATRARAFEPLDLNRVVEEVLGDLQVMLEETGADVTVDALPTLEADPTQMHQLFQNLISNALKFHAPGEPPTVHVRAAPAPGDAHRIDVVDQGIGFDERFAHKIFLPFQRLHGRSAYEGTGIGLAICRRIVERHGGRLTATSEEGAGSTFTIVLPARQPRASGLDGSSPETPEQPPTPPI